MSLVDGGYLCGTWFYICIDTKMVASRRCMEELRIEAMDLNEGDITFLKEGTFIPIELLKGF